MALDPQAFDGSDGDQSLRAQLEEAIDEHEEDGDADKGGDGDLSPLERQMLRNLLHFSEHDADDVAIPRGEIIAIPLAPAGTSWSPPLPSTAIRGCRFTAKRWTRLSA